MSARYQVTRTERVDGTNLHNVYFRFGAFDEGNVTVSQGILDTPMLESLIELQISRMREQQEQLAAGGE